MGDLRGFTAFSEAHPADVVLEVLDAWLAPEHRYFKLRAAEGDTYLVRHDEQSNAWELTMFRAERP